MTDAKPSKSERKRQQAELQQLGVQLLDLPDELLATLELGERLSAAIADARRMKSREALRRQRQYIGKLMRDVDPAPIRELFDRLRADDRRDKRVFANAERWRDRLTQQGRSALADFEREIGAGAPALAALLDDLENTVSDRDEKHVRRQIFRELHAALAARRTDG